MTTKSKKAPKRSLKNRLAANKATRDSAKRVAERTPAERKKLIADAEKHFAGLAPSMEAATSDLLGLLQTLGCEFIRRYYPSATGADFSIWLDPNKRGGHRHVWLSMPVPADTITTAS